MVKGPVRDILYGHKAMYGEAMVKSNHFMTMIRRILDKPIHKRCIAATCDIWTDDYVIRCYLDFSVFRTIDEFKFNHTLIYCKHFSEDHKTVINIWQEMKSIFESFNVSFGDTPHGY